MTYSDLLNWTLGYVEAIYQEEKIDKKQIFKMIEKISIHLDKDNNLIDPDIILDESNLDHDDLPF